MKKKLILKGMLMLIILSMLLTACAKPIDSKEPIVNEDQFINFVEMNDEEKLTIINEIEIGIAYHELKGLLPELSELQPEGNMESLKEFGLTEAFVSTHIFEMEVEIEFNFEEEKLYSFIYWIEEGDEEQSRAVYERLQQFYENIHGSFNEEFIEEKTYVSISSGWLLEEYSFGITRNIYNDFSLIGWGYQGLTDSQLYLIEKEKERIALEELENQIKLVKSNNYQEEKRIGGAMTDGKAIYSIKWFPYEDFERVIIEIPNSEKPPYYEIDYQSYPYRMTFYINGVRRFPAMNNLPSLRDSELLKEIYSIVTLDDSAIRFNITLREPVVYELIELPNTGFIIIDFKRNEKSADLKPIYSVRTASYPNSEMGAGIIEMLLKGHTENSKQVNIIKSIGNNYFVEEGVYSTEQEALGQIDILQKNSLEFDLFIEKRGPGDMPGFIKE